MGGEILPKSDKTKPWLLNFNNTCSASLIDKKFVLTAFHCISSKNIDDVKSTFFVKPLGSSKKTLIKEVYLPYDDIKQNDVADVVILELKEEINIDSYVKIPNKDFMNKHYGKQDIALLVGYGVNDVDATPFTDATQLELSIMDRKSCNKLMKNEYRGEVVIKGSNPFEYMICDDAKADKKRKNKDIGMCAGDSGGPLVIKEDNSYYQIGTVSGYSGDGKSELCGKNSAYYGNMSFHNAWIEQVINSKVSPSAYDFKDLSSMGYYYSSMNEAPKDIWVLFGTTKELILDKERMPDEFTIFTYDVFNKKFIMYNKSGENIKIPAYTGFWFVR